MLRLVCLGTAVLLGACGGSGGGGGAPAGGPRVVSVSPAPGEFTGAAPTTIDVGFDQAMNAATIDDETFLVTWSGGDGSFNEGNEVTIQALTLGFPSTDRVVFDLTTLVLPDEFYRLRLVGTGPDPIRSDAGLALDGDFGGTLPSGNGSSGGDFVMFFQTSLVVEELTPAPGSALATAPGTIVARIGSDADPSSVTAATFRVLRSGGDGNFRDDDEVVIAAASITRTGPAEFTFDLTGNPLPADNYQVTLAGGTAGRALHFSDADGTGDFVRVAASPDFRPGTGSWTVECWVMLDDPTREGPLVECADGDFSNGWRLGQTAGGPFRFEVDGANGTRQATGTMVPAADTWYHVAGVHDAAVGATHLYVDGALAATDGSGAAGSTTPAANLYMGTFQRTSFLQGTLDEVRVWSTARGVNDFARSRYRALTGNEGGLVGYWPFDELAGQGLADLATPSHVGSLGVDGSAALDDPARLASTAWPRILDVDGNALDGTFSGTLPSGIGLPGVDFAATFLIQ
ncbi:MAG: LamG domain-containing protein [Planctomycetota bacterium]